MLQPVILIVLDGWGISTSKRGNAISKANKPTITKLNKYYPMTALQASGISVGIPWGEPGNSEVGHMTLGAGQIIYQNLPRISLAIQEGTFFQNKTFLDAMTNVRKNDSSLHLMGLVGSGTTHSYIEHLYALLELAKLQKIEKVFVHIFTDGRDSPPTNGVGIVKNIQERMKYLQTGKIASVCGRSLAMDRNNNWERTEKVYNLLTKGEGEPIEDVVTYLQMSYDKGITDEFISPGIVMNNQQPLTTIKDKDSVIFFNFREDRARQLTKAFVLPSFDKFPRSKKLDLNFVTMVNYEKDIPANVAFPPKEIKNGLGEILSQNHKLQLRIAETEKYAHVTYFFNGGKEQPWPGEDRILIPSPTVSHFNETPEMSAYQITERVIQSIELKKYDFILINYANPDMVGHTGDEKATIKAIEIVDECLSMLVPTALKFNHKILITADHGNAEQLINPNTGEIDTQHTSNPVPLWFVTPDNHREKDPANTHIEDIETGGILSDVAPTILELLNLEKPKEMTGESLLPILR